MLTRVQLLFFVLLFFAGSLSAAPVPLAIRPDRPAIVIQTASVERLFDEVAEYLKATAPKLTEEFEALVLAVQGERGLDGIDLKKPVGVAVHLKAGLEEPYAVVAVPITSDKKLLAMLERHEYATKAEEKADGVLRVRQKEVIPGNLPLRLRIHDGYAYVGLNAPIEALSATNLVPADDLIDSKEAAPVRVTVFPARVPVALRNLADGWWAEDGHGEHKQGRGGSSKAWSQMIAAFRRWSSSNTDALFREAESVTTRLKTDSKAGDYGVEVTVTPRTKSQLAADIGAIKPTAGRFHQLVTKDAVGGGWLAVNASLPKELRAKGGPLLTDLMGLFESDATETVRMVLAAFGQAMSATVADGTADLGFAVHGPDKGGHYTGVAAVAMVDAPAVEKAFRGMAKKLAKESGVTLDAEKVGELAVHTVALPDGSEWLEKLFGKGAAVRVAFSTDTVFIAIGPAGKKEIERAGGLKPTACKVMDVLVNPAKVKDLFVNTSPEYPGVVAAELLLQTMETLGTKDGLRSQFGLAMTGGKQLTVTHNQYHLWPLARITGPIHYR